jgi:glucokinase
MSSASDKAIGIDIGGTRIAVGAVNKSGDIEAHKEFPTQPARGFEYAVARIDEAIQQVLVQANWSLAEVAAIGVGCTGPVNRGQGTIHNPYTLPSWENKNIVAALRGATGRNVHLENDADAALLGEHVAGAGKGVEDMVMLTLGTGVGGGVLIQGRLHRGIDGAHPELGHVPVDPDGPDCYCGQKGCLEVMASGTAITRAAKSLGLRDSREVFVQAAKGNHDAREVVHRAGQAINTVVCILLHTFLPELIVLGGGVMNQENEPFVASTNESIQKATMAPANRVRVVRAELGTRAGVVGAASLAFDRTP